MRLVLLALMTNCALFIPLVTCAASESRLVDLTFLHRLQANEVPLAPEPVASGDPSKNLADYPEVTNQPSLQAGAQVILSKLLAAYPGKKPSHITFMVTTAPGFNCSTLPTGEILCTCTVLTMLLPTAEGQTQLAFLLAHELGHRLIAGHSERFAKADKIKADWGKTGLMAAMALDIALSKRVQTGSTITITATPAATSALWNSYFGGIYMGQTASGLASLAWSQKDEDEADQFGAYLMQRAGYDITLAPQLFSNLNDLVRTGRLEHESIAKQVAIKAANAAALQALVNGKSWTNIVGAGVLGGFSAMEEVSQDHYHRDFGDRMRRCAVIVDALQPDPVGDDLKTELAGLNIQDKALAAAAPKVAAPVQQAAMTPVAGKSHVARNKRTVTAPTHRSTPAPPPPTPWELAQGSLGQLREIELSEVIIKVLATKHDQDALAMCPDTKPQTAQLAFSCGLALAAKDQKERANALFAQALADPFSGPKMFRNVALTQAEMKDEPRAMTTLDQAEARFPDGQFLTDRVSVALATGDQAGAKAAGDQCQKNARDTMTKLTCISMLAQAKPKMS